MNHLDKTARIIADRIGLWQNEFILCKAFLEFGEEDVQLLCYVDLPLSWSRQAGAEKFFH